MITSPHYWIFLLIALGLSFLPVRIRTQSIGVLSFLFLFVLIDTVTQHSLTETTTNIWSDLAKYSLIYWLIFWTVAFYYIPRINLPGFFTKFRSSTLLILGIILYLAHSKYLPDVLKTVAGATPIASNIIPLGVSYFSFKLIHYLIEYNRGRFKEHTFLQFWTYISFFPIYTAGPIERFENFLGTGVSADRKQDFIEGTTRIIYGLIKKFFISGVVLTGLLNSHTGDSILQRLDAIEHYKVWGFLILNYLIVYMDFSAYSDIAIGSARILGFRVAENFNWPILASNVMLFWKRWHISLGSWCQSYVYMPTIGLTRQPYLAIILTFLAIGVWHAGALNWAAWGIYHGVGVIGYRLWVKTSIRKKIASKTNVITQALALLITNLWIAGSFAFTATYTTGTLSELTDAVAILRKCLFLL